ncbi:MAG: LCP family protein [Propionibacteriales bacterium]|nr:LCP family protein [Propionibacteriales bacterium]
MSTFMSDDRPPKRAAAANDSFRRTVAFTVLGTILPGLGLIAGKRKVLGTAILATFLLLVHILVIGILVNRRGAMAMALNPDVLRGVGVALGVGMVLWVGVILVSHVGLRPRRLLPSQRALGSLLVGGLAFLVAAPLAVGAVYSYSSADSVGSVFKSQKDSTSATKPDFTPQDQNDPWKDKPRVNILLLGGDSNDGQRQGVRTDTVIVASIDTKTGNTTLISLPRNTARMPFPKKSKLYDLYPNGFTNGDGDNQEYALNAMYDNVPAEAGKDVLGKTDNVGADVLKLSVGEATGLKLDYYLLLDIEGFRRLINALGGITVNVNQPVAVGGNTDKGIAPDRYLKVGPNQHLNGADAMWFARGRFGSDDFERMGRQRCTIDAIISQANPQTLLSRYEAIAREGKNLVITDIPQEALPAFADLSLKVKDGQRRSLTFVSGKNGFISSSPDFDRMRERVKAALGDTSKQEGKPSSPGTANPPPGTSSSSGPDASSSPSAKKTPTSPSTGKSSSSTDDESGENTQDACAYNPV